MFVSLRVVPPLSTRRRASRETFFLLAAQYESGSLFTEVACNYYLSQENVVFPFHWCLTWHHALVDTCWEDPAHLHLPGAQPYIVPFSHSRCCPEPVCLTTVLGLVIHTLWTKILLQNFLFIPKVEQGGTLPLWESVRTWSGSWPYPQYTEEEGLQIEGMRQRTRNKGKRDRILVQSGPGSCGTSYTPPMLDLGKEIHPSA